MCIGTQGWCQRAWNLSSHLSTCGTSAQFRWNMREDMFLLILLYYQHQPLESQNNRHTTSFKLPFNCRAKIWASQLFCSFRSECVCACRHTCTSMRAYTLPWDCLQGAHRQRISALNSWVHRHSPRKWRFNKKNCSICPEWKTVFKMKHALVVVPVSSCSWFL